MIGTRIFRKLFSLVAVLAVAVCVLGVHSLVDARQRLAAAGVLVHRLDVIEATAPFVHELQQERGMTAILLEGASGNTLRKELQQMRIQATAIARYDRWRAFGLALVMLLTLSFLFVYAHYVSTGIAHPIEALLRTIRRLEQEPDAAHRVELPARDELREVALAFNRLQDIHQADDRELRLAASVFEHSIEGVMVADTRGNILSINAAYARIMGYTAAELVGLNVRALKSGRQTTADYTQLWSEIGSRGHWRGELWNRRKGGSLVLIDIYFAASVGITFISTHETDAVALLREADEAMYRAKAAGGNQVMFHRPSALEHTANRMSLENRLHKAIEKAQFLLHFQPVVELRTGRMVGAEALIRWQENDQLVSPGEFIPVAEDSGLIVPIGDWVMREACRQLAEWRRENPDFYVAINLSPRQFVRHDLVERMQAVLDEFGLAPAAVEFEITESAGINMPEEARRQVLAMRALGLRLAIDDFGTGHSSLTRLKEFPMDTLKIDRSFVQSLPDSAQVNTRIVRNTIQLARDLGLSVVAEGVETAGQWHYLVEHGAQFAQGYLFSTPLPPSGIEELMGRAKNGALWSLEGMRANH